MEKIRNRDGKLTRFLTGRRFIFIEIPDKPLVTEVAVGGFKASLYHKEQPKKTPVCKQYQGLGHWASQCPVQREQGERERGPLNVEGERGDDRKKGEERGERGDDQESSEGEEEGKESKERSDDSEAYTTEEEEQGAVGGQKPEQKKGRKLRKNRHRQRQGRVVKVNKKDRKLELQQTKLTFLARSRSLSVPKRRRSTEGDSPTQVQATPGKAAKHDGQLPVADTTVNATPTDDVKRSF